MYKVQKVVCAEKCVGITGCQTVECLCKECFDYKCYKCQTDISREEVYVDDFCECINLCPPCKHILFKGCKSIE